jgi:hypothetical protein
MNLLGVVQLETFQLGAKLAISKLNSYTAQIAQKDVPSKFYQAGPKDFS